MPLDPSIPLQAGQGVAAPVNPLTQIGQFAQTGNALLNLKQGEMTMGARQAIGPIYQQAINPQTGVLDTNKLLAAAAADPRTAWMAGDLAQQALTRQQQQTGIAGQQLDQTIKRLNYTNGMLGGLLAKPGGFGPKDVVSAAGEAIAEGVMTPGEAAAELAQMPQDPNELRQWTQQHFLNTLDAKTRLEAIYGTPQTVNAGGTTYITQTPTVGGPTQVRATIGNTMSPDTANTPTQIGVTPQGAPVMGTRQQFSGVAQGTQSPFGSGRYPGAPTTGTPAPGGGVVTGLGPGQNSALEAQGGEAAKQYQNEQTNAANFAQRQYQWKTALNDLQTLGPTGTGPGSATMQQLQSLLTTAGILKPTQGLTSYDEANKYLIQAAMAQPGASQSDERLATALSGNASTHISNLAAQDVVRANIALDRQRQAAVQSFNHSGLPVTDFPSYMTNWSTKIDPRVYAFDLMTPQQRTEMFDNYGGKGKAASPQQKATFYGQLQTAVGEGLVTPPEAASAPAPAAAPAAAPASSAAPATVVPTSD